jgi:haloalkane dehalogenase
MSARHLLPLFFASCWFGVQLLPAQGVYAGQNQPIERNISADFPFESQFIALGFLGFGKSSFPADRDVSIEVQYQMLCDFIEAKQLQNVTLFMQDIGSIAGMLYAIREPQNVKGMALFEAPFMPAAVMYDQLPFSFKAFMKLTRTARGNEKWMVDRNFAGKKTRRELFHGQKVAPRCIPLLHGAVG